MDKYEYLKDLATGSFGWVKLMRNKSTKELVAMKFLVRGDKIDENVKREIINHRQLLHPNIIRFKEVLLTQYCLVIVMEYAAGGELFDLVITSGKISENAARYFFQQLISGISYCHFMVKKICDELMKICHRDLKLANTLLDGSPEPNLKICDFGFSKSSTLDSTPKSTVGTAKYIAPEILLHREYDGQLADVWSCGVTLYIMLVGKYPFGDQKEPNNLKKTIQRILVAQYEIPDSLEISKDCRHLLSRIFVASANMRITIQEIKKHPWFLKNLPRKESEAAQGIYYRKEHPTFFLQSLESIMELVREAKKPVMNNPLVNNYENDDDEEQNPDDDEENLELEGQVLEMRYVRRKHRKNKH